MTSQEMYQEFEVHMDKIDSQDLPEIRPEQVFIFLNTAVDEYIQAIRNAFEVTGKIADDAISLIKRVYIPSVVIEDRVKFDYNTAYLDRASTDLKVVYYFLNGRIESHFGEGDSQLKGISNINYIQQDDINPALVDPFNKPKYYDKIPCVRENEAIYATPPGTLVLDTLVGTALLKPAIISQSTNCDLREQVHKTIVKRAAKLALENVESIRTSTFDK